MSHSPGEPSFFPVLRDELDGEHGAANDDALAEDQAPAIELRQKAADRRRTLILAGASLGLCAALLGWYALAPLPTTNASVEVATSATPRVTTSATPQVAPSATSQVATSTTQQVATLASPQVAPPATPVVAISATAPVATSAPPPVAQATDDVVKVQTAYTRPAPSQADKSARTVDRAQTVAIAPVSAPPRKLAPQRTVRRPVDDSYPRASTNRRNNADSPAPPPASCSATVVALGLCDPLPR